MSTKLPILYHKGKKGELRSWQVWTEGAKIYTEYGVVEGELQTSCKEAAGKNIGRSNETTPDQQADLEAKSLWQFKLDRKYSETPEAAQQELLLPMLAKDIDYKKVQYPCSAQNKLDGNRALAFWEDGKVKLISRSGKEWTIPTHINEQLEKILPEDGMFDGELYVHGQSCQIIGSWIKKTRPETKNVEYHVYDMPIVNGDDSLIWSDRLAALNSIDFAPATNVVLVETETCNSQDDIISFQSHCVEKGYEGAIVRNWNAQYTFGYRSADLMKVKTFQDAEFKVISCREGVGKMEGCAVFTCLNDLNKLVFECTPAVSMEARAEMYMNKANYIGKKLTVKFFGRTDDGLPRHPVGLHFRVEEDLP